MPERERLAARAPLLVRRALLNRAIRAFFDARGFLEIEAPLIVPSPGLELHLDAFAVADTRGRAIGERYLITSPEYQLKRLVAGGLERVYSLGKVFRAGEAGAHHNPEFTMLEWYRAHDGWQSIASDVEWLVCEAARALNGTTQLTLPGGAMVDLLPPWPRVSVREAMQRWAGVQLDGDEDAHTLRARVRAAGHRAPDDGGWDDVFFTVFLDAVEPHLGVSQPTIVHDWPAPLCALARRKPDDGRVVERFEAYAGGLELCNGFGELVDAVEQRQRLEKDQAERRRRGLPVYPIDERFLQALAHMPPSGGVAVGVDRLAMLLMGAKEIRDVLPFAWEEL